MTASKPVSIVDFLQDLIEASEVVREIEERQRKRQEQSST